MSCEDSSEFVKDLFKLNIYNQTDEGIELLIENRAVKDCFEFWYETALDKPLAYKRNAKAVPIETGDFYKMLEFLLGKIDEEKCKDLLEECKKYLKVEKTKSFSDFIIGTIKDAAQAGSVWQAGFSVLGNICEFVKK